VPTPRLSHEEIMQNRVDRREDRDYATMLREERLRDLAKPLVGRLQGEQGVRFYINVKTKAGAFTGRIKEFASEFDAVNYLIRNNYV
jgi:hypothetical protein